MLKSWPLEDVWLCFAVISVYGFPNWRQAAEEAEANLRGRIEAERGLVAS